ncbi:Oligo-1,6-glucosidase 1 [compost metagenome]
MYFRRYEGQTWLVTANFSREAVALELPGIGQAGEFIIRNYSREDADFEQLQLRPYEAFAVKLL